jgi:putative transposase
MMLSDGIAVSNPRTLRKHQRKITRLSRQLSKRQHAKTKQERLQGVKRSNNYKKLSSRLGKEHRHVASIRRDFTQKLTTILTTTYEAIAIEDLNVKGMQRSKLAKSVSDMAFGELRRQIEYKAAMNGVRVEVADRFFASSKTCHVCGHKHDELTLRDRTYVCPHCGTVIDRDLNAALNLLCLITSKVGTDYPELTPADLTALHSRFTLNGIATSKVETGRQRKL